VSLTGARRIRLAVDRLACGSRLREAARDPQGAAPALARRGRQVSRTNPTSAAAQAGQRPPRAERAARRPARVPARRTVANAEFSALATPPNQSLQATGAPARLR
jgi:hypothetical protein